MSKNPTLETVKRLGLVATILRDESGQKAIRETDTGTIVTMVASTAAVDRDGEVIEVEGWHWDETALPKLLAAHNSYEIQSTIGRCTKVWRDAGRLMIEAELADKVEGADLAKLAAGLVRAGMLDQGSVGFMPEEWKDPDGKVYTRDNPGPYWGSLPGRRYTKCELLEFSLVPVPSQRDSRVLQLRALGLAPENPVDVQKLAKDLADLRKQLEARPADPDPMAFLDEIVKSLRPLPAPPMGSKVGAVLSRVNKERLTTATDLAKQLADVLAETLASATPAEDEAA